MAFDQNTLWSHLSQPGDFRRSTCCTKLAANIIFCGLTWGQRRSREQGVAALATRGAKCHPPSVSCRAFFSEWPSINANQGTLLQLVVVLPCCGGQVRYRTLFKGCIAERYILFICLGTIKEMQQEVPAEIFS